MGRKRIVYTPDPLVLADVCTPVAVFSAVTVAPETKAPLGSVIWPVIDPVTVWPKAKAADNTATNRYPAKERSAWCVFMEILTWIVLACFPVFRIDRQHPGGLLRLGTRACLSPQKFREATFANGIKD